METDREVAISYTISKDVAQLTAGTGQPEPPLPAPGPLPAPSVPAEAVPPRGGAGGAGQPAVEVDRVVPASGNMWIGGQQVWLGPALSGRQITVWWIRSACTCCW